MHISVLIITFIVALCAAKLQVDDVSKCEVCKSRLIFIRSNTFLRNWVENSELLSNLIYDVVSNKNLQEACENLMICPSGYSEEIDISSWDKKDEIFNILKTQKNNSNRPRKNNQPQPPKSNKSHRLPKTNNPRPAKNNTPRPPRNKKQSQKQNNNHKQQRNNQNHGVMHHVRQIAKYTGCRVCPKCC